MSTREGMQDAMAGGMWGLLIGDAAGVPYEFTTGGDPAAIDMPPPAGLVRSHPSAPPQAWSDDGAHALCLLASLLERGRVDVDDLGQRLLRWFESGYMAVDGVVFDVGVQTRVALSALRRGVPAAQAGPRAEYQNGNGSLMRVLPLALWHRGSDEELVRDAARQSVVTHGHLRSQICCALYCLWVRAALRGADDPWAAATRRLRAYAANEPDWTAELDEHIRPELDPHGRGSGYVVDCLHSARFASQEATFEGSARRSRSATTPTRLLPSPEASRAFATVSPVSRSAGCWRSPTAAWRIRSWLRCWTFARRDARMVGLETTSTIAVTS